MPTYYYDLPEVSCGACTGTIDTALRASPLFRNQTFITDASTRRLTIVSTDEQLGYLAVRDQLNKVLSPCGFSCDAVDKSSQPSLSQPWLSHHVLGGVGISVGVLFMLAMMLAGPLPLVVTAMMAGLSVPLTLFLGAESYQKALKKGKLGKLTMDTLFSISTLTILLVSSAAFFFPTLPMMFDAGLLIFGFRHMGIAIKDSFNSTAFKSRNFQDDAPKHVLKCLNGQNELVSLALIQPEDDLVLAAGEIIPLDGMFVSGSGFILDTIITGKSHPRSVKCSELLFAGTQLMQIDSPLVFRVKHSAADSHLARLDGKILSAKAEKAPLETATSRIIQYFIPAVVCLAIASGVLIACFFSNALAIQCAVSVLVSACPCTLGLITPLAVNIGMRKTAAAGIVFKSAKALEAADNIQCVVFDLNGTLTRGEPVVARYKALLPESEMPDDLLLRLFAHLEGDCTHPAAKAIRDKAKTMTLLTGDTRVELNDHSGLVVRWQDKSYALGSEAMMLSHGVTKDDLDSLRNKINPRAENSVVYLAREGELIGYVVLHDPLRDDAIYVIKTLQDSGKQVHLCTGADQNTAERYAALLGIDKLHVRANCVSNAAVDAAESKINYLNTLKAKGFRVAAVGDAGNDAEMIVASDVGFAMKSDGGDERTQQHAAAVIQGKALSPILQAFSVAEHMVTNIKQNLMFSLVYNIATVLVTGGLLLAIGVVLNPAIGAALMMIQASLILLNVRRFATQQTCTDAVSVTESPSEADTNVSGHGNSMRLAHSNREGFDKREGHFDQSRYLLRHGFYKLKCSGLNKVDHELAESRVVNGVS